MSDPARLIEAGLARAQAAWLRADLPRMEQELRTTLDLLAALTREGRLARLERAEPAWDGQAVQQLVLGLLARLKAEGCAVFPFAGTLLGLERDGRLLPHDKDADLALWLEDFALAGRLLQAFGLRRAQDVPPFGNVASYVEPASGCTIDLFGLRRDPAGGFVEGGAWFYGLPPSHQRVLRLPWFGLAERAGPAGPLWWPDPAAALLQALYGDWRRPQPEWDSLVSNCALLELNLNWRCWALKNLCQRWLGGDLARTRRLLETIAARGGAAAIDPAWREALDAGLRHQGTPA